MIKQQRNVSPKFGAAAAILCFCVFALAGCGGSGYSSSSSTKPPPPTTQPPPPTTAPVASNGSVTTTAGTAVNGTLSASGSGLTYAIVAQPAHGTVSLTNASTGAFTYTPSSGFTGSDSFTFTASNSAGTSNTATESVTVSATALTLAVSPATQTLAAGASATLAVTTAGGSGTVTLGLTGSTLLATSSGPGNISWSYAPASITAGGSSTLTLNVGANVPAGTYNLTLTASTGSAQATTPFTLRVSAVSSTLTLAVAPTTQSVAAGANTALAVNILGGSGSVTLGLTGSTLLATSPGSGNISWAYAPASVTTDGSSLLTLAVGANVPAGTYNLTLSASAGSTQATTPLTLTVSSVSSAFTLAVSPTTQSVAASASTTLAVSTTGATGNVTLGLTGSTLLAQGSGSAAINWSYAPASIAGQGSSTLTLAIGANVPAGTYYLTLSASAGSTQVTTPLTLTVASPPVGGHPLWSADFSTITLGDIVGDYGSGTPPDSQTMKDLEARGWSGEGYCPTQYGYCPGAVVVVPGPTGTPVHALRYRYEEGPTTDANGTGLEVKLALETAFFPGNPLAVNGGLKEVYVRYYLQTQPVPANTPACTPNCPTTSTVNNVATKEHYWKSIGESGGPSWGSFVTGYGFGSTELNATYQEATDCPFQGGVFNCPNIYQNVNQVNIDDNQWYCVEYHWKDNTVSPQVLANGDYEMWINGTQVIESASRQWDDATHQTALDYFMIYRQSGGFQWRFETDLVIDTQPIPCLDGWTPPPPSPPQAGTMGENTLGTTADSGRVGLLSAQKVQLTTAGTLQSLSFYVASGAAGSMHLAVYNDLGNGIGGQPGVLLANTADFTVVNGWNTQPVITPVTLQPGTYWLAFEYTDPGVQFLNVGNGASLGASHTWGALPAQWGELYSNLSGTSQWSFYATLTGN